MIRQMNVHDLRSVANIHKASFPDDLLTNLGQTCLVAQYQWFYRRYPDFSLVYELDNNVAGFVVGAMPGYRRILLRQITPALINGLFFHPGVVARFGNRIIYTALNYLRPTPMQYNHLSTKDDCEESVVSDELYLAVIAVSSSYRRQGIASDLILAFEDRAKSQGGRRVSLSVHGDNTPARAVYEKMNWYLSTLSGDTAIYKKDI